MKKIAVITGGSSGIGFATVKELVSSGYTVYELSRRDTEPSENVVHIKTDVTDPESLRAAIDRAASEGEIAALICCAGGGISGAVEFTEEEEAKRLFDLNFFGVVSAVRAVIPHMRKAGKGNIIIISSVAAALAIPFQVYYSATKAALNAFAAALANEVAPFGIGVCAVMPGDIKTGFSDSRKKLHKGDDVYSGRISRSVELMERDERNGVSPEKAGKFISALAARKSLKPLCVIGFKYRLFVIASRILPVSLVNKIVGSIYSK